MRLIFHETTLVGNLTKMIQTNCISETADRVDFFKLQAILGYLNLFINQD